MFNKITFFVSCLFVTCCSVSNMYADSSSNNTQQYINAATEVLNNTLSNSDENIQDAYADVKKYLDDNSQEIILEKLGNLTPKDHEDLRKIFLELPENIQVRFIAYIQVSCMATTTVQSQDLCLELTQELNDLHTKSMQAKKNKPTSSKNPTSKNNSINNKNP
ncbi:hypothetical protein HAV_00078 [Candidatus Hepatincola sp. Av]